MSISVPKQRQKRAVETKNRLLDAGLRIFGEQGYHAMNTKIVAKEAGVSIGNFYNYFRNKRELIMEVFRRKYAEITEQFMDLVSSLDLEQMSGHAIVGALVDLVYAIHMENPGFHEQTARFKSADQEAKALFEGFYANLARMCMGYIASEGSCLRVQDTEAVGRFLVLTLDNLVERILSDNREELHKPLLAELQDMMARYLFKDDISGAVELSFPS